MNDDKRNDRDQLAGNVKKLLTRVPPELKMSEKDKQRVLAALLDSKRAAGPEATTLSRRKMTMIWKKSLSWATAAAAVILVAAVIFWPGGINGGLIWADVVKHFNEVETLVAHVLIESETPAGTWTLTRAKLFQQDPGTSRTEIFLSPGREAEETELSSAQADSVDIFAREMDRATILRLAPREKQAWTTTLSFGGTAVAQRAATPPNPVAESWTRLKGITSVQARSIGEKEINGVAVEGFEADIQALFKEPAVSPVEGVIRVWADAGSGVPMEVEAEFTAPDGSAYRTTITEIEWNAELESDLFTVPDLEGWQVREEKVHQFGFSKQSLRDGVTLSVGISDEPPVLTERDIEAVLTGKEYQESGQAEPRRVVFLTVKSDAASRLREFTASHQGESVVFDFNDELRFEIRIGGVIERELQIDITALGIGLEEFEATYLVD